MKGQAQYQAVIADLKKRRAGILALMRMLQALYPEQAAAFDQRAAIEAELEMRG